jgi:hypothetical protein
LPESPLAELAFNLRLPFRFVSLRFLFLLLFLKSSRQSSSAGSCGILVLLPEMAVEKICKIGFTVRDVMIASTSTPFARK